MLLHHTNLFIILSACFVMTNTMAAYALSDSTIGQEEEYLFSDPRHLQECYEFCPVFTTKIESEWNYNRNAGGEICCGEPEECCDVSGGFYVFVLFIIFVIVIASCACCACCPLYDKLCCSPNNGPCCKNEFAPEGFNKRANHSPEYLNNQEAFESKYAYDKHAAPATSTNKTFATQVAIIEEDVEAPALSTPVEEAPMANEEAKESMTTTATKKKKKKSKSTKEPRNKSAHEGEGSSGRNK